MKSTWVTVRRTGWRCSSLTMAGYTLPSTVRSSTVFEAGGAGQGEAQVTAPDGDRDRRHAVAVEDGRDVVLGPHAAGRGAARRAAGVGDEHGGCHGVEPLRMRSGPERPAHDASGAAPGVPPGAVVDSDATAARPAGLSWHQNPGYARFLSSRKASHSCTGAEVPVGAAQADREQPGAAGVELLAGGRRIARHAARALDVVGVAALLGAPTRPAPRACGRSWPTSPKPCQMSAWPGRRGAASCAPRRRRSSTGTLRVGRRVPRQRGDGRCAAAPRRGRPAGCRRCRSRSRSCRSPSRTSRRRCRGSAGRR